MKVKYILERGKKIDLRITLLNSILTNLMVGHGGGLLCLALLKIWEGSESFWAT